MMAKSPAWTRKEGKNPKGGLNAKGRASAKAQGMNLKCLICFELAYAIEPKCSNRTGSNVSRGHLEEPAEGNLHHAAHTAHSTHAAHAAHSTHTTHATHAVMVVVVTTPCRLFFLGDFRYELFGGQ